MVIMSGERGIVPKKKQMEKPSIYSYELEGTSWMQAISVSFGHAFVQLQENF